MDFRNLVDLVENYLERPGFVGDGVGTIGSGVVGAGGGAVEEPVGHKPCHLQNHRVSSLPNRCLIADRDIYLWSRICEDRQRVLFV